MAFPNCASVSCRKIKSGNNKSQLYFRGWYYDGDKKFHSGYIGTLQVPGQIKISITGNSMALDSSSPFGTLSKGRSLFADNKDVSEQFTFPPYNNTLHASTVLNASHSTLKDGKFDGKTSMSNIQDKIRQRNVNSINISEKFDNDKSSLVSLPKSNGNETAGRSGMIEAGNEVSNKCIDSPGTCFDDDLSDNEDVVECGNCDNEFQTLQDYMDHTCTSNWSVESLSNESLDVEKRSDGERKIMSDVESFEGKIVYNPDGSAYIIEGDSDNDIESIIKLPQKKGAIVDKKGSNSESNINDIPQIGNAFFVPRNPKSYFNSSFLLPHKSQPTAIMHSYRVYDLRSGRHKSQNSGENPENHSNSKSSVSPTAAPSTSECSSLSVSPYSPSASHVTSVPMKPILMCFICKLSFGFSKSFMSHAVSEHLMELSVEEKEIMSQKNSSAIIQGIGRDKEPLMSFLEPIKSSANETRPKSHNFDEIVDAKSGNPVAVKDTTTVSYVYTKPKLSDSLEESNSRYTDNEKKDLSIREIRDQLGQLDLFNSGSDISHGVTDKTLALSKTHNSDFNDINESNDSRRARLDTSDDSNSQSSFQISPMNRYMSEDFNCHSPGPFLPPYSSSQRQGFFGVCEEHPNGRVQGVECPNCDMILSTSQNLGGHMTMMHSRNSCKTLKCPKCNWHYKYQETLEIHMKEKHPEGDQKCMYCMTSQTHPRLARGESYSCGYKPYRCEICNYSTTTKGNLSIHMQSDKHLNNVQDLTNTGGAGDMQQFNKPATQINHQQPQMQQSQTPTLPSHSLTPSLTPPHQQLLQQQQHQQHSALQPHVPSHAQQDNIKKIKPKPTWRCDVCNYETNVARNLRIHMTSEKHTHNMMVLQQNMKHMQRDMQIHQMNQLVMLQDPSFLGLTGPIPGGITFPYDGSLMIGGLLAGFGEAPVDLSKENCIGMGPGLNADQQDVNRLFQCCVCNIFGTDSLEVLHQHLQHDRTKAHENANISVSSGTYMCNLCQYKTTLKANFQLHCKTDKHIQRLQLVNHIKEGGTSNEWRLKYLNVSNPVQIRCNACDYYTNSIHKLQIHTGNLRHEASAQLFCHLLQQENVLSKPDRYYYCALCKFNARVKLSLMQHVHSVQHLHSESMKQIEMKENGQVEIDIGEIFMVKEIKDEVKFDDDAFTTTNGLVDEDCDVTEPDGDTKDSVKVPLSPSQTINNNNNNTIKLQTAEDPSQKGNVKGQDIVHQCPYCNYSSLTEMHINTHVADQHPNRVANIACPLCQEPFIEISNIQKHLTSVHNVNTEGLHKLLTLVEDSNAKMAPALQREKTLPNSSINLAKACEVNLDALELESSQLTLEDAIESSASNDKDPDEQFRCQTCSRTFANIDQLYSHQNELGHLELKQTPGGPGYLCWKKGCNQYFKTAQALQMHFREIHAKSVGLSSADRLEYRYQCQRCTLAFKSQQKLHLHAQMHDIKSAISCNLCAKTFQSILLLSRHVETSHDLGEGELEQYRAKIYANALAFSTFMTDPKLSKVFNVQDLPKDNFNVSKISSSETEIKENGDMDSECDNSPVSTPVSMENGIDKGDNSEGMDLGDTDLNSKEHQFFEDYINCPSFAEGAYEDVNRKFKCHRCRVAFTKQHYLTAHKSLNHPKGDKISYLTDKFLDPNRPYKCEICKESFTQKNILLVHYNSVSHLHKLKQQSSLSDYTLMMNTTPVATTSSHPLTTRTVSPAVSSLASADRESSKKLREASPEDESARPYKCNICKVSYSQGSTLDIHIRSVAHQARASKLHELAMTGEVDLSRPLIEEPVDKSLQAQHKLLNEFLTKQTSIAQSIQSSLLFQGLPGLTNFSGFPGLPALPGFPFLTGLPPVLPLSLPSPMFPTSTAINTSSHSSSSHRSLPTENTRMIEGLAAHKSDERISQQSSQADKSSHALLDVAKMQMANVLAFPSSEYQNQISGSIHVCQRCSAVFASQEVFIQHHILCSGSSTSPTPSLGSRTRFTGRIKTAVQRNLLQNFGFECVMQFNEFNQRTVKREEEVQYDSIVEPDEKGCSKELSDNSVRELKVEKDEVKEDKFTVDLPEMNKCVCNHCSKQFSSVWVLKAHEEEVHKEIVPLEIVEEVGDKFKTDFEKKIPKEVFPPDHPHTPLPPTSTHGMEEKIPKQEMPPPPPPLPTQMQMDMLQMMNMFNMGMMPMPMPLLMNTQSSLMPMMVPSPGMDMKPGTSMQSGVDPDAASLSAQQKRHMEHVSMANQKRARTRINDEQLKVLRGYFDINNSPAEEQIQAMSEQTGLPMKVIKHWFRNTLFKERQRNKDSPYNFNNPPSTTLDLEEYEKTGKLTVIEDNSPPLSKSPSPALKSDSEIKKEVVEKHEETLKTVPLQVTEMPEANKTAGQEFSKLMIPDIHQKRKQEEKTLNITAKVSTSSFVLESPSTTYATSIPITSSVSPLLTSPVSSGSFMQNFAASFTGVSTPHYPPRPTTPTSTPLYDSHSYSPPSGSTGRRANRTRFTDYQIKCLQEYFEQNAYPKDDELEHLSKMLGLSPRVIVVWFQNARQKARKIYENQPADNVKDNSVSSSSFSRTGGLNYQCKKCQAVFQRYYDLIRHQKRSCFVDTDKQESSYLSDDSDSMSNLTSLDNTAFSDSDSEGSDVSRSAKELNTSGNGDTTNFHCDKCDHSFISFEHYRDHQSLHTMSSSPYLNLTGNSPFGMLQNMASTSQLQGHGLDHSAAKRKYEDDEDDQDQPKDKRLRTTILPEQLDYLYQKYQVDCNPSRKQLEAISKDVGLKKRVVQVWFQNTRARERKGQYRAHQQLIHKRCPICRALFRAKSALESHLATKHPEEMAKGDINIDNIPDAAIESPGPSASSMIPHSPDYNKLLAPPAIQGLLPYMPPASLGSLGFPSMADPVQMSMTQFYEDSFKKYINELSSTSHVPQKSNAFSHDFTFNIKPETTGSVVEEDAPLDLSKPLKVSTHSESEKHKDGPASQSSFSSGQSSQGGQSDRHHQSIVMNSLNSAPGEQNHHISGTSSLNSVLGSAVDQSYMINRFHHDSSVHQPDMEEESSNVSSPPTSPGHLSQSLSNSANKRYRTQMTSLQVKIMKMIFIDYKTPTMAECEMLGRVIGLQKRVVQVWFQNARAKEKKAKLNMKSFGQSDLDFTKPPEKCTLCSFKYSHKYTIQDHIFTKKHIDKVREFIQLQSEAEREMSSTAASMAGVSGLLRSQQANDVEHMRQLMEEANTHSHLAQLQSFGLAPLGLPPGAMAGIGLLSSDFLHNTKPENCLKKESKDNNNKPEGSSSRDTKGGMSVQSGHLPFGGLLPGMDAGMLPFMYHGLPGLLPAMPALQHGFMPGAGHMLGYDPMTYGTPLALLQIPQQAIKDVSSKLNEPKAMIGQYTQDCKSISSLRSLVSSVDYNCAQEATVDVGYICKKCQMVYPAKDACVSHQRMMCFPGVKYPDSVSAILKLEQIQYECKVCSDKVSTVHEFKLHCDTEFHKKKLSQYQLQRHGFGSSTPKNSVSLRTIPSPRRTEDNDRRSMSEIRGTVEA